MRIPKKAYYLNIALECSKRGTCLRRNYGAVIVNNDQIISTGYTGAPRGRYNCSDLGKCKRQELNVRPGEHYELCRSVHAEMNAVIHASRCDMLGATIYINGFDVNGAEIKNMFPCELCKRVIINAGISKVVTPSGECDVRDWIFDEGKDIYS